MSKIRISGKNRILWLELNEDKTLSVATLRAQFGRGAAGLSYKDDTVITAVSCSTEGLLILQPQNGWNSNLYYVSFPDEAPVPEPPAMRLLAAPEKGWNSAAGVEVVKGIGVFHVYHLHEAGPKGPETIPAYARDEAVTLFADARQALKETKNVLVFGPPGCGKSLIMWQLACHLARRDDFQSKESGVLWVQLINDYAPLATVSLLTKSGIQSTMLNYDKLEDILDKLMPWLVVVDGITVKSIPCRILVGGWCEVNGSQFIFVNSPQARMKPCDRKQFRAEMFQLYDWTETDLLAAFNEPIFYSSVESNFAFSDEVASHLRLDTTKLEDRNYLFLAKFMLAGHSVQRMFDETPRSVLGQIREDIRVTIVSDGAVIEATLFCTLKPSGTKNVDIIATSAYVLARLLERGNSKEGRTFLNILTAFSDKFDDAGCEGILLEIYFRAELVRCEGLLNNVITLLDPVANEYVSWPVKKLLHFQLCGPLDDLETYLLEGDVWLVPVNWKKFWSFEFVCINPALSNGQCVGVNIRVVQISRALKNVFDFEHVRDLIERMPLEVNSCEVFVILPTGEMPPKIIAIGRTKTDRSWEWSNYKFLEIEQKELMPMDVLASMRLKKWP